MRGASSPFRRVGRGGLVLAGGRILVFALALAVLGLTTRVLGPDQYGIFSFVMGVANLLTMFEALLTGAGRYGIPYLSTGRPGMAVDIFFKNLSIILLLGALSSALLLAGGRVLPVFQSSFVALIPFVFFFLLTGFLRYTFYCTNRFGLFLLREILLYGALLPLLALGALKSNTPGVLTAYSAAALVTFAVMLPVSYALFFRGVAREPTEERVSTLLGYSFPFYLSQLLKAAAPRICIFALTYYAFLFGPDEIGFFNLAFSLVFYGGTLILSIVDAAGPTIMSFMAWDQKDKIQEVLEASMKYCLVLAVPMAFALPPLAGGFIGVFFGREFAASSSSLGIMSFMLLFSVLAKVFAQPLFAYDRTRTIFFVEAAGVAVTLALALLLVPHGAASGASLALLGGTALPALLYIRASLALGFRFPAGRFIRLVVPGLVFLALTALPPRLYALIPGGVVAFAVYLMVLHRLGEVRRTDVARVLGLFRPPGEGGRRETPP